MRSRFSQTAILRMTSLATHWRSLSSLPMASIERKSGSNFLAAWRESFLRHIAACVRIHPGDGDDGDDWNECSGATKDGRLDLRQASLAAPARLRSGPSGVFFITPSARKTASAAYERPSPGLCVKLKAIFEGLPPLAI